LEKHLRGAGIAALDADQGQAHLKGGSPALRRPGGAWRRTPHNPRGEEPQAGSDGVVGVVRLDHDLARVLGAPGMARDLDQLLGHPLAGPEIGAVKPLLRRPR
jgi:hypothetical protein